MRQTFLADLAHQAITVHRETAESEAMEHLRTTLEREGVPQFFASHAIVLRGLMSLAARSGDFIRLAVHVIPADDVAETSVTILVMHEGGRLFTVMTGKRPDR